MIWIISCIALLMFGAVLMGGISSAPAFAQNSFEPVEPPEAQPETFWKVVNAGAHLSSPDERLDHLAHQLENMSKAELIAFKADFERTHQKLYRWDLWAAAFIIHGGASDDGFHYFLSWLISKGQGVTEEAVKSPENLVDILEVSQDDFPELEEFEYVVSDVFAEKYEDSLPIFSWPDRPKSPIGAKWEESQLSAMYPRLSAWAEENG